MKPAKHVTVLEDGGVPFGLYLAWDAWFEHEHGVDDLVAELGLRRHASGLLVACSRNVAERVFFGAWAESGAEQALLVWKPAHEQIARRRTPAQELRRGVEAFEQMWSPPLGESDAVGGPALRGGWDDGSFAIHARTPESVSVLTMLGAAFIAEDLAVAVCTKGFTPPRPPAFFDPPGLALVAPGLCPRHQLQALARAQSSIRQNTRHPHQAR